MYLDQCLVGWQVPFIQLLSLNHTFIPSQAQLSLLQDLRINNIKDLIVIYLYYLISMKSHFKLDTMFVESVYKFFGQIIRWIHTYWLIPY
jgi:hypothetical protein